jgi:amino acid transporter
LYLLFLLHDSDLLDWKATGFIAEGASGTAGKLLSFIDCCSLAIFSYTGSELLAMTAHDTEYPRRDIPLAVRRVSSRLFFCNTATILILGLTVSPLDPLLLLPDNGPYPHYQGPFIIMVQRAGVPGAAHFINLAMIIAVFSVVTGDLYVVVSPRLIRYGLNVLIVLNRADVFPPCQIWITSEIEIIVSPKCSVRQKILFPLFWDSRVSTFLGFLFL